MVHPFICFFFNDTATTEIYTLSLHDALPIYPLLHLPGGLVGEGDRQDLAGLHAAGAEQVGDPVGQHPGLARAGTGDDEQRAALVDDGLPLRPVEAGEHAIQLPPHLTGCGALEGRGAGEGLLDAAHDHTTVVRSGTRPAVADRRPRVVLATPIGGVADSPTCCSPPSAFTTATGIRCPSPLAEQPPHQTPRARGARGVSRSRGPTATAPPRRTR